MRQDTAVLGYFSLFLLTVNIVDNLHEIRTVTRNQARRVLLSRHFTRLSKLPSPVFFSIHNGCFFYCKFRCSLSFAALISHLFLKSTIYELPSYLIFSVPFYLRVEFM